MCDKSIVEAACPIGPLVKMERDSFAFYFSGLFHKKYAGPYAPDPVRDAMLKKPRTERTEGTLEIAGKAYRLMPFPKVSWHQAGDDVNFQAHTLGFKPLSSPRHFHAGFTFLEREIHIDYFLFIQWGPLSGVEEFIVFADGRFSMRGGSFGIPPAGGSYNRPLLADIGPGFLTVEPPLKKEPMALIGTRLRLWIP